jgi:hypothetical protein
MSDAELDLAFEGEEEEPSPPPGTQLVERPAKLARLNISTAAIDASSIEAIESIGAYTLSKEIVRAPGAWLFEAIGQDQERYILQLTRCRPVQSAAQQYERRYFERRIADETALISSEPEMSVIAHGGLDRPDGSRVLFWALPWNDGIRGLADSPRRVRDLGHFLDLSLSLAKRLARRHALQRAEPLLSEHLILIPMDKPSAELIGVPVHVPHDWLATEMIASRLAPEEIMSGVPKETGDLWRLGQALTSLAVQSVDFVPVSVSELLAQLSEPDPARRMPRASQAIVELEALRASVESDRSIAGVLDGIASTMSIQALAPDVVSSLMLHATADSTRVEAAALEQEMLLRAVADRVGPTIDLKFLPPEEMLPFNDDLLLAATQTTPLADTLILPRSALEPAIVEPLPISAFVEELPPSKEAEPTKDMASERSGDLDADLLRDAVGYGRTVDLVLAVLILIGVAAIILRLIMAA